MSGNCARLVVNLVRGSSKLKQSLSFSFVRVVRHVCVSLFFVLAPVLPQIRISDGSLTLQPFSVCLTKQGHSAVVKLRGTEP